MESKIPNTFEIITLQPTVEEFANFHEYVRKIEKYCGGVAAKVIHFV